MSITISRQCLLIAAVGLLNACDGGPSAPDAKSSRSVAKADNIYGATSCGTGDGSDTKPYIVCTIDQLNQIGDNPYLTYYLLGSDIDLSPGKVRMIERFVGVLDGADHALSGLVADGSIPG